MTTEELLARLREANINVPPSQLLRASVAARVLGVHQRTLQRWRYEGTGPAATRLNASWFYSLSALAGFLDGQSTTNSDKPGQVDVETDVGTAETAQARKRRSLVR